MLSPHARDGRECAFATQSQFSRSNIALRVSALCHARQERLFSIVVIIFALVGFSYVVGSITGSLTQLRALKVGSAARRSIVASM